MINWIPLQSAEQIEQISKRSHSIPCLIFKHSTTCDISAMTKYRLEDDWDFADEEIDTYFLDLFTYKKLSNDIAESFQVHHESPQVILIRDGFCTYDASHLDISVAELRECFHSKF